MILSVDWLRDYVSLPNDLNMNDLAHALTLHAVEVEGVERLGTPLNDCVFAAVLTSSAVSPTEWHLAVDDGAGRPRDVISRSPLNPGSVTVVCSASSGQNSVRRPSDFGLEMIADDAGRDGWRIPGLAPAPGAAVASALGWDDEVIEIDNKSLTNRPDLWCHEGVARELAAIYGLRFDPTPVDHVQTGVSRSRLIDVVDESFCNRLSIMRVLRHGAPLPSTPLAIRSRLAKVGQRPINFYSDLTNYVMFATGQPSHAYDARLVNLPFSARRSNGVTVDVLSGAVAKVPSGAPMIVDASKELSIAGIVGGRDTSVTDHTADVLIELGSFDARSIRDSSLSLGIRTDASSRFEKALDTQAIDRGGSLLRELVRLHDPAAQVESIDDVTRSATVPSAVETSLQYLNSRMGTKLSIAEVTDLLTPLGFAVRSDLASLVVDVPSWRSTGDIKIAADILEEVGRRIGYDELPLSNPVVALRRPAPNPLLEGERRIREFLAFRSGSQEILTYPWSTDRLLDLCGFNPEAQVRIIGAPSDDRSSLRPSLIPNLLGAIETNLTHRSVFSVFELGSVYLASTSSDSARTAPQLSQRVAAAFVGAGLAPVFRHAAGAVLGLARAARTHLALVEPTAHGWGDEVAARNIVNQDGHVVGHLAAIDLNQVVNDTRGSIAVCFEIATSALTFGPSRENVYSPVSAFPTTTFDLSVLVPEDTGWSVVRGLIDAARVEHLRSIEFLDEFKNDNLDSGMKSITFRLTLTAPDRTLSSVDREHARNACLDALSSGLGGRLR